MIKVVVHIINISISDKRIFLDYQAYLDNGESFNGNLSISFPRTALEANNSIKTEILKNVLGVSRKSLTDLDIILLGGAV